MPHGELNLTLNIAQPVVRLDTAPKTNPETTKEDLRKLFLEFVYEYLLRADEPTDGLKRAGSRKLAVNAGVEYLAHCRGVQPVHPNDPPYLVNEKKANIRTITVKVADRLAHLKHGDGQAWMNFILEYIGIDNVDDIARFKQFMPWACPKEDGQFYVLLQRIYDSRHIMGETEEFISALCLDASALDHLLVDYRHTLAPVIKRFEQVIPPAGKRVGTYKFIVIHVER